MIALLADNSGPIGLLIFFIFFAVMVSRLCRPGAKQMYDNCANIPFMEDSSDK
jgi:cbb3-type cytochrome oxidase subunit 3